MPATRPAGNTVLAIGLIGVVAGMAGLAYASVPLYRLFCQVTGYGGTTQVAAAAPGASEARMITVRFDATVSPSLPWRFEPTLRAVEVAVGEERLAYFRATNLSDRPATGMATFNVTPHKAGLYFKKIACFCFDRQVLEPGESVEMPVSFYVDPEIAGDANLDEVKTITLSYTFFPAVGGDEGDRSARAGETVELSGSPPRNEGWR